MAATKSAREYYEELVALTSSYLLQEYQLSDRLFSTREEYCYFFDYAKQKQQQPSMAEKQHAKETVSIKETKIDKPAMSSSIAASKHVPEPSKLIAPSHLHEPDHSHRVPEPDKTSTQHIPKNPPAQSEIPLSPSQTAFEQDKVKTRLHFALEHKFSQQPVDVKSMRKAVLECYSNMVFIDSIPGDAEAKKNGTKWMQQKKAAEVIILSFNESNGHQTFLANLKMAIHLCLKVEVQIVHLPAIISDQMLEQIYHAKVKLIIANRTELEKHPQLFKDYREDTKCFLKQIPLNFLSDIETYLNEPRQKALLWDEIQQTFKTLSEHG